MQKRDIPAGQHCSRPEKAAGRAAVRQRHSRTTICQWPSCSLCTRESAQGHGSIVSKCMQCCSPLPRPQTREKTQRYVRSWARPCVVFAGRTARTTSTHNFQQGANNIPGTSILALPKSQSFTTWLFGSSSKFCGLMSL